MISLYLLTGFIALLLIIILIVLLKPNKKQLNDDLLQQLNTQIAVQEQKIKGLQEDKIAQENKNLVALEKCRTCLLETKLFDKRFCRLSSGVECFLGKEEVTGSNPVIGSKS